MPYSHKCIHCELPFSGRKNQKFCNTDCKNDFHNSMHISRKKQLSNDCNKMELNRFILHKMLNGKEDGEIFFSQLENEGFDMSGPFKFISLKSSSPVIIIGDYELKQDVWKSKFNYTKRNKRGIFDIANR